MQDFDFILDKIYTATKVPVRYIGENGSVVFHSQGYSMQTDPLFCDSTLRNELCKFAASQEIPYLYVEDNSFLYSCFFYESMNAYVLVGPICTSVADDKIESFCEKHKIATPIQIRHRTQDLFLSVTTLLYYYFTNKKIENEKIATYSYDELTHNLEIANAAQVYMLERVDIEFKRLSYLDERTFMGTIFDGNVEAVKNHFDTEYLEQIPKLAKNEHKHFEYLICSSITLATRAAINGGVDATTAYAMSDLFLHSLENCKSIESFLTLQKSMMIAFASKVRETKAIRSQNFLIDKTKHFIKNHLNKRFTLDDIVKEVNVSKSHLCRLFLKQQNMSITHYTHIQRIEAAKNLLKYSDEGISSIAAYLCFPSQSHFGKIFKQVSGLTPQQYRNLEKLTDTL